MPIEPSNNPIDFTPYAESGIIKNPMIVNLNYTNQDFWSMKTRLIEFIKERFGSGGSVLPDTFNDFVESDLAIMLIENFAFIADTLSFKMDQIANEVFIDTVTEPENAFRLAYLVGFKPRPPIAAKAMFTAEINAVYTADVQIATPVSISIVAGEAESITYELYQANSDNEPVFDENIIIPAGNRISTSVVGIEGRTTHESTVGSGAVAQMVVLDETPVIYDSIRVMIDGIVWSQVDYFTDSQPRREYMVQFDSDYRGHVTFGNNRAGLIPSVGSDIVIQYRVGGGSVGNIVTGYINFDHQASVEGVHYTVPVNFRNYTKGQNGYNGDSIEDVRQKLPAWTETQNRAVSGTDYKTLADQFATPYHGRIGKSAAVLRHHGCAGNIVDIYVLAHDGVDDLIKASVQLKVDLEEELDDKKMFTDFICIKDGTILEVNVLIDIMMDRFYRKFEQETREQINRSATNFFSLNNWEYGKTLLDSELIKHLSGIKEVQNYVITFTTDTGEGQSVTARFYEIIRAGGISLNFIYT